MINPARKNIASSVRQRLLNFSKKHKIDYQLLLIRYGLERFLYRLSQSNYKEIFVLKGALLFLVWDKNTYRPTRDADFLGKGDNSLPHLKQVIQQICTAEVTDDGVVFHPETVKAIHIKEDQEYEGVRITFDGNLSEAKIPIQIDIGFGDTISPDPQQILFPTLLEFNAPILKAYPRETVISEKFQAMVQLGIANSRMKDFYDIWIMSERFQFEGESLSTAMQKTFDQRKTTVPSKPPFAFTAEFYNDPDKQIQWQAFIRKNKLHPGETISFEHVINRLQAFIMPLLKGIANQEKVRMKWTHTDGWISI